jgi:hypothetical protein
VLARQLLPARPGRGILAWHEGQDQQVPVPRLRGPLRLPDRDAGQWRGIFVDRVNVGLYCPGCLAAELNAARAGAGAGARIETLPLRP